ncbi:MAG: alpha/beta hydrolase [Flavobacteriaceae bacterium]|nr:alpha/beta hydrolase [Flavobacteriaceae bacterium]
MYKYLLIFICSYSICQEAVNPIEPTWKDLNYAGDGKSYHTLDIYSPTSSNNKSPLILTIYGSAWKSNRSKASKYIKKSLIKPLIDAGFAVASINHRSSTDALFPAQIHDVKAAIRFLRGNASEYKIDPSFVGVTGSSSGGHLAAMAGTTSHNKLMEGNIGSFLNYDSHVNAVVDWFGPTDFLLMDICGSKMVHDAVNSPESKLIGGAIQENKEKARAANPINYISSKTPPFLIIHGMVDLTVPYCQSKVLKMALERANIESELISVRDGGHGKNVFIDKYKVEMVNFFLKNLKLKNEN